MKKAASMFVAVLMSFCFTGSVIAAPKAAAKSEAKAEEKAPAAAEKKSGFQAFNVYSDDGAKDNHFIPSGWMGDYGDLKVNIAWKEGAHSGKSCIKITYTAKMTQGAGWTGTYWQQPSNNWGDKKGGFNLTGASKLTFWAKGDKGGEKISEFKMGGITGEYPDSDSQAIGPIELSNQWQKYTIDLKGKDLSNVIGGFCWSASKDDNPNGFTIFIDDVMYE